MTQVNLPDGRPVHAGEHDDEAVDDCDDNR